MDALDAARLRPSFDRHLVDAAQALDILFWE
jgi:hypothetical protein